MFKKFLFMNRGRGNFAGVPPVTTTSATLSSSNISKKMSVSTLLGLMWRVLKLVYKNMPLLLVGNFVFIIAQSLTPFATRYINSAILDEIISMVGLGSVNRGSLINLVFLYVLVLFAASLVSRFRSIFNINIRERLHLIMEMTLMDKFSHLDTEYYEDPDTSDLLQRADRSYTRPMYFFEDMSRLLLRVIGVVTSFTLLASLDYRIMIILAISAFPSAINNSFFGRKSWEVLRDKSEDIRDFQKTKGKLVSEDGLKEIRIFGVRKYLFDRAIKSYKSYFFTQLQLRNKREFIDLLLGLLSTVGSALVFYMLIDKTLVGVISVGLLTFYLSTSQAFAGDISDLFSILTRLYEVGLYVLDVYKVLDLEPRIVNGTKKLSSASVPLIEFRDVSFTYPGTKKPVLKDFNLTIEPGQHVAIVGENGAGKTTIVKLLMRFYDVQEGVIYIDGEDIRSLDIESWYDKVATLFQEYNFYHFNARDNIGIGDVSNMNKINKIRSAAKKSGAHNFIQEYENKYEQILSKSFSGGINPSTGQKQKIALARAFFKDSPVLIMDEPTSAIDPKAEYEIFEELLGFATKKTVIMVSHRFSTVRNADRILVLEGGIVVEDGNHESLVAIKNGRYKHAFDLQKKGFE